MAQPEEFPMWATGRRKTSVARVRIIPGEGRIVVNDTPVNEYFPLLHHRQHIVEPMEATESSDRYDIIASVEGGGLTGQAGALRHGIARALEAADPELRSLLKEGGYLTRDPRMKERKKYGRKKARKSPQFSKR